MQYYEPISEQSIFHEIDRICNTTNSSYKIKQKIARVNEGLDQYWFLAAQSAPQFTFDDTGNTSAPLETQNIVAGTNAYKITDFTNNVLQVLRVTVLNDDAEEEDLIYQDFEDIDEFLETYSTDTEDRGQPQYWTKFGDYIYIGPTPDYTETNGLRCYVNRELTKITWETFTTTNASNQIDDVAHGLSNGNIVILSTNNTLPAGYSTDTDYYVVNKGDDKFQVATAGGGSAVAITNDGTGTHQYAHITKTPGIPIIHHDYLARYAARKFMKRDHPNFTKTLEALAQDKIDIEDYWQTAVRPGKTIIETKRRVYK